MRCSLAYVDFEGRSDGRSIKSVLAHVAPLKLVCTLHCLLEIRIVNYHFVDYKTCVSFVYYLLLFNYQLVT